MSPSGHTSEVRGPVTLDKEPPDARISRARERDGEGSDPPAEPEASAATEESSEEGLMTRREMVASASVGGAVLMAGGVGAGFLWPRRSREKIAVYTCLVDEVPVGDVKEIRSPRGERIYLLRTEETHDPEHILAIGTTCTHLGCRVFYRPERPEETRFHCPCHQGFFDQLGNPTGGPPERALPRYEVEVRGQLLFLKYNQV